MSRRLGFLSAALLLVALLVWGCGNDESPASAQKTGQSSSGASSSSSAAKPEAAPPEQPAPSEAKAWPYLSGDYEVPMAADLLTRNILLIFDGSGSMGEAKCSKNENKIDVARRAVKEWSATVPPDANLGLVTFYNRSQGIVFKELGVGNREELIQSIDAIVPGGKTPLTDAFKQSFLMLEKQAQQQLGYGEYTIVVVTDGIANNPGRLDSGGGLSIK